MRDTLTRGGEEMASIITTATTEKKNQKNTIGGNLLTCTPLDVALLIQLIFCAVRKHIIHLQIVL
ncbi:unnamed protein product [Ixodes pacificus]